MSVKKIKVLCIPSDRCGCGYYRSLRPHTKLDEMFGDEFDVTIDYKPNWKNIDYFKEFDIVHIHKGLYDDMENFYNTMFQCKNNGTKLVLDLDDYWDVGPHHPHYLSNKNSRIPDIIKNNIRFADYVTTTTDAFADEIREINPNVKVFVNSIDPEEEQFIPKENPSERLRIGFVMGSSHIHDMELLEGMVNKLGKQVMDKIQIVLCGYDLRGTLQEIMPDGQVNSRPIKPTESVWYEYEKILTDNYNTVSPEYKDFLLKFIPNSKYPDEANEPYARRWTKGITEYCTHYNDIDILFVPLEEVEFNKYKSELKLIEAGMMNKAVVASNFGPYKIGTVNFFEKGGKINENGNVVLIDQNKAHKDWAKTVEKLLKHPEYVEMLRKNLHESVKDKYNLSNVTKERAEWYKEIVKK